MAQNIAYLSEKSHTLTRTDTCLWLLPMLCILVKVVNDRQSPDNTTLSRTANFLYSAGYLRALLHAQVNYIHDVLNC